MDTKTLINDILAKITSEQIDKLAHLLYVRDRQYKSDRIHFELAYQLQKDKTLEDSK
jgi:hypothetical protein